MLPVSVSVHILPKITQRLLTPALFNVSSLTTRRLMGSIQKDLFDLIYDVEKLRKLLANPNLDNPSILKKKKKKNCYLKHIAGELFYQGGTESTGCQQWRIPA